MHAINLPYRSPTMTRGFVVVTCSSFAEFRQSYVNFEQEATLNRNRKMAFARFSRVFACDLLTLPCLGAAADWERFDVAKHFDTVPELADRAFNRPRKETLETAQVLGDYVCCAH